MYLYSESQAQGIVAASNMPLPSCDSLHILPQCYGMFSMAMIRLFRCAPMLKPILDLCKQRAMWLCMARLGCMAVVLHRLHCAATLENLIDALE
jgi:hypothetical protein